MGLAINGCNPESRDTFGDFHQISYRLSNIKMSLMHAHIPWCGSGE
jgi:hypothetical protein